ncbi:Transposase IS116/IS110/IS902 family protein [Rhodococcus rhodochrous J3]|uniref:Transposase IS116/IS110/IS902 family protein n=1 Tax=Rhodococcus rhodochrous J3 TaxID=903528 RepID=A0ABY1MJ40_RHORH|nr:Transposase IS116/IS110/IS902 family protein [Rhodococcus rhodochrous J3]
MPRPPRCARSSSTLGDLVKTRTQTVNRLHVVLTHLIPAGAARGLSADRAAEILRRVRPRDVAGTTLRSLAADLVAEVGQLDRRIDKAARDIEAAVAESGSSLTQLCGIAALNAGIILARVGSVHRFRSAAAFASYTGTVRSRRPPGTSCATASPGPVIGN